MDSYQNPGIRNDLIIRKTRLQETIKTSGDRRLLGLLQEVETSLKKLDDGTYGLCETCHEPIETERIINNPLTRFCLDHLPNNEKEALEYDLNLASQIQHGFLPPGELYSDHWEIAYLYKPAGVVSGDYCDLLPYNGDLYFSVGDVSGKGVSAALLMSHLHATFRALVTQSLSIEQVMEKASRIFCEVSLPTHFATLVIGKASDSGEVEICNAGHNPIIWLGSTFMKEYDATGLPLGMFCDEQFSSVTFQMKAGDRLLLYTDGLTEAMNPSGTQYGMDRLVDTFKNAGAYRSADIISTCIQNLQDFRNGNTQGDDMTIMVLGKR